MIGADPDFEAWNKAFDVLIDFISTGRKNDSNYEKELVRLEDTTDFSYDISGWLEDYLSELDMREWYVKVQEVCEKITGYISLGRRLIIRSAVLYGLSGAKSGQKPACA